MAFKKNMNSKTGAEILIGSSTDIKNFPIGFQYKLGANQYRVVEHFRADNTDFCRLLNTINGEQSDATIETLVKDSKEKDYAVLPKFEPPARNMDVP